MSFYEISFSEVYFAVVSVSTIIVACFILSALLYILSILSDVKRLSKIAKKEAEIIAKGFEKGASIFGGELSEEASGFVRTVFALLLAHFAPKKNRRSKTPKTKNPEM